MAKRPTKTRKTQTRAAKTPVRRQAKQATRKRQTLPAPPAVIAQPHPWLDKAKNIGFIGALLAGLGAAVWGGLQHPTPPAQPAQPAQSVGPAPLSPIVITPPKEPEIALPPVLKPQELPPPPALDSGPGRRRHRG